MATIRKRGTKYQVQIRRYNLAPLTRSFHTKADAEEWARHMEAKADRGDIPASVRSLATYTVRDLIERYRDEITVHKKSCHGETCLLNAFLRQPIADLKLTQVTPAHFSAYRGQRLTKVKAGTVNSELGIIKHAFDLAEREWDIPTKNPLAKLRKLKVNNARNRRLTDAEYDTLMEAAQATRNPLLKPLIDFAIETGMRRGEILRIQWRDIDYERQTLLIPITKNGDSRIIPLTGRAMGILKELRGNDTKDQSRPFPMSDNAAKLAWQRLVYRAAIEDLHFHDFRHEAVSRFFEMGLSVPEVALISGHKDFRMLFRYTHLKAEELVKKLK